MTIKIFKFLIWCAEHDCDPGYANSSDSFAQKLFDYIKEWESNKTIREPRGFANSFSKRQGLSWTQVLHEAGIDNL